MNTVFVVTFVIGGDLRFFYSLLQESLLLKACETLMVAGKSSSDEAIPSITFIACSSVDMAVFRGEQAMSAQTKSVTGW